MIKTIQNVHTANMTMEESSLHGVYSVIKFSINELRERRNGTLSYSEKAR